jgi:acetyltransferase-like isoleucine patch superfamily enzyme
MAGIPITKMLTIGMLPSVLKVAYYRMRGARIGRGVSIGLGTVINSDDLEIQDDASIGVLCFINARRLRIGRRVRLNMLVAADANEIEVGDDSVIMEQVVIGGMLTPRSRISIGKRCKVFPYCFLNPTEPITIEDDVGIGGSTYIFTHGSWQSILDGFPVSFGPVTIKRGVWFPWRVFVMPNVTVGEYATIGAGSIITRDIPGRSLAVGSPAKVIKEGSEYIKTYTKAEKTRMVVDILREFTEFLDYLGASSAIDVGESWAEIEVKGQSDAEIQRITFSVTGEVSLERIDILVSLDTLPNEVQKSLSARSTMWFDIEGRRCSLYLNWLGLELKAFLSRYGLRFEPT